MKRTSTTEKGEKSPKRRNTTELTRVEVDKTNKEIESIPVTSNAVVVSDCREYARINIFKGDGDKSEMPIEKWLKYFNIVAEIFSWSDTTKSKNIMNYLEGTALSWYLDHNTERWDAIQEKMKKRFSIVTIDPLDKALDIKYEFNQGLKWYYEEKVRFCRLADLNEKNIIRILIRGLPKEMAKYFITVNPSNLERFYEIAANAERNVKEMPRKEIKRDTYSRGFSKPRALSKKKAPNPCRICEQLGYLGRYHWASDCRNKIKKYNKSNQNDKQKPETDKNLN